MKIVLVVSLVLNVAFALALLIHYSILDATKVLNAETTLVSVDYVSEDEIDSNSKEELESATGVAAVQDQIDMLQVEQLDTSLANSPAATIIPAIPGLTGFEFRKRPPPMHPAEELAAEIRDPGWATDMENRIFAGIAEATDEPMTQIEVECRMTWCGIVVSMPEGGDRGVRHAISKHLKAELSFNRSSTHGVGGPDREWVAIYLQADR